MNWRYPWILIMILLFVIIKVWQKLQRNRYEPFPKGEKPLIDNLFGRFDRRKLKLKRILHSFSLVFLIFAAAGPQIGTRVKPVERKGVDLVFAIDVSLSMNAVDVKPSRLEKAKLEITQLVNELKGDRVGLIVFAGASHFYLPLTTDYEAVQLFINAIDTEMIPTQGTAINMALNTAISAFTEDSEKNEVLVLITDGEDHEGEAVETARKANETGIIVHAVGVGTKSGSLIPIMGEEGIPGDYKRDRQGKPVTSRLNEAALKEIAAAGGGVYVRFDNRLSPYAELMKTIDTMEKYTIKTHEFSEYEDRYQIFSLISLLLFVVSFMLPTRKKQENTWRGRFV